MEGILMDLTIGSGVFLGAVALLVLALGAILIGHMSDQEKAGKIFFWTESDVPGPELRTFLPRDVDLPRAA